MPKETLGPLKADDSPARPSQQLIGNREVNEKMIERIQKKQESLANTVNKQLVDQRQSPFVTEIVLYRLGEGPSAGEQRPAIVLHLLGDEGDTTRCVLKVLCNPDLDGTGVIDEPNVRYGTELNEWMPSDPRIRMNEPKLKDRVPVGDS